MLNIHDNDRYMHACGMINGITSELRRDPQFDTEWMPDIRSYQEIMWYEYRAHNRMNEDELTRRKMDKRMKRADWWWLLPAGMLAAVMLLGAVIRIGWFA